MFVAAGAEAAFESAEHQVINRAATGRSIDIAAKEVAGVVAAAVTGIAGAANFANLLGSLKVGFSNESAEETVEKTFVDKETKTLAVLRLLKKMRRQNGTFGPVSGASYKIKVEGEFWVIKAGNDAALAKCQAVPTKEALGMLASLTLKAGPGATEARGRGVYRYANGDVYDGEYNAAGEYEGRGVYRCANGDVYDGEYKAGEKEGRGVYRLANGSVYDGEYKADYKEGRGVYRFASGNVESGFYKQDADVGEGVRWMADGRRAARLRDGKAVEMITLEEARQTVERLGLPLPSPLPGA